ncbi:MAG TPA: hypothetical protein VFN42_03545, partial [Acetobacteraceae bacterium]|nr:hypothetical protein [Acetobacteraceae bacterium]
ALFAVLVLLVPAMARRRIRIARSGLLRPVLYFPALGLGFLFIEIALIEKASLWLNDRTSGFALVLTGMLVFSGIGSMAADRLAGRARMSLTVAGGLVLVWCAAVAAGLPPAILATLDWPWAARVALLTLVLAPASLAMGLPFPLGLSAIGEGAELAWAWGLNGAFSVLATPLAHLVAREWGFHTVILAAALLYLLAVASFPAAPAAVLRSAHSRTESPAQQSRIGLEGSVVHRESV